MIKKLKNIDFLFTIMILAVLSLHIYFLFAVPFSDDESHYATVAFRLINGESLVQHEWHLTQFASLFTYLPVKIWISLKGSADGLFIFLRCVYLTIHTSIAVLIYRFFREYGKWAILASMMFYVQMTYRIQAISYQSMFVLFLLLLTLCLLSIYKKKASKHYVLAGLCFGCCCVCNPLFCLAFALYLAACALWTKRDIITKRIVERKALRDNKEKKLTKKQKRQMKQQSLTAFPELENYSCFFNKTAILKITCGIIIIAVIAASFFFLTGGTIDSIFDNAENLLNSSEYTITDDSASSKLIRTLQYFNLANLYMPWILPVLFIVLFFDKKRKTNLHRVAYLSVLSVWTIVFIIGVMMHLEIYVCAISLPFSVISLVCYILTEKKNKTLFYCMYLPCLIAALFQYLAANTLLGAFGIVLAISNVAGVLFAKDLWKEMRPETENDIETINEKKAPAFRGIIIIAFCLQILFYGIFYQYGQVYGKNTPRATTGPYRGLYMSEVQYDKYNKSISDINLIKERSQEKDPVLFVSYNNWMYLYMERPFAVYTTWYRGAPEIDLLIAYYKENSSKIPKYIYVESSDPSKANLLPISEIFEFEKEELSNGMLLTVTNTKF